MVPPSKLRSIRFKLIVAAAVLASPIVLWIAIHRIPWLGPFFADNARRVLGPAAVGRMEDLAYGIDDWWKRQWHTGDAPQPYWEAPSAIGAPSSDAPALLPSSASAPAAAAPTIPAFRPVDLPPMHKAMFARGDGAWIPIPDRGNPDAPPPMFKTLLHPDTERAWAAVAIVAVDLRRVRLSIVAGHEEPKATLPEAVGLDRPGLIPDADTTSLLAAFNGGFKTIHGGLGMAVGDVTLVPPQKWACTVAAYRDGALAIRTWTDLAPSRDRMLWWRQAPTCVVEFGELGRGVGAEGNINWGKSVDGSTIIRRSAIGLSRDTRTLFVGMGDATSAGTIAMAMRHAGAYDVAQLDVNVPYPKFLFFDGAPGSPGLRATPLTPWMAFEEQEYIKRPSLRDFFYLTRLPPSP